MGIMGQDEGTQNLARILCYGTPFLKKTWWALRAAEIGYNVILCDFDNGARIANQIEPAALKRIFRVDMRTAYDKSPNNSAFAALSLAMKSNGVYYDDDLRIKATTKTFQDDHTYTEFNLLDATHRDVLIIDSWTSVCTQLDAFADKIIDPLAVNDVVEQSYYKKTRTYADRIVSGLQRLNCHVIIIGHEIEYAKRKSNAGKKDTPDQAIEWIKDSPSSVTKAHGYQMAKDMTDALHFELPNAVQGVYVSTQPTQRAIVGSQSVAPQRKPWAEMGIELFLPSLAEIPEMFDSKAVRTVKGSDILANAQQGAKSLDGTTTPKLKIGK